MSQSQTVTAIGRSTTGSEALAQPRWLKPAILNFAEKGEASFFLQFGGQAAGYIDDLRRLYQEYPLLKAAIEASVQAFREEAAHPEAAKLGQFQWGTDVLSWITKPETTPPASYLASSVVSQALIFITQAAHFLHLHFYGVRFEDLRRHVQGVAGHSQGIMSAVWLSLSESESDLRKNLIAITRYFTWQGIRMQAAYPTQILPQALLKECETQGWGVPSPMLALNGLTPEELHPFLQKANEKLDPTQSLSVTLLNGWRRVVVSGSPVGLVVLRRLLDQYASSQKSKPYFAWRLRSEFLAVQGPYHSQHMAPARQAFESDIQRLGFAIPKGALKLPVLKTDDGSDLRDADNILQELTRLQFVTSVNWPKICDKIHSNTGVTHVVDFGPGEMASALTFINCEGQGVVVVPYATPKGRDEFLSADATSVRFEHKLWQDLAPKVAKLPDGSLTLDNAYVRFTGRPPIFGGGMTPTTVEVDIVAAAANSGYLVEWAGGGQVTETMLRARSDELAKKLQSGEGYVFNALYLDAYLWGLHFPLLTKLKAEGHPIDGLTISAGVPTREKASEILATLKAAGLWCNAFKPGSDDQIRSVLEIADDHPQDTLLIQIEGGKAGGHHSWEDLYGLVERHYAAIRRRKNLILCVGGGISDEQEATRWLMGTWHASGRIMPVDAVFIGTRLMAAKEAKTAPEVKKLLVGVAGTPDWVGRGEFKAGMTSGQSQLGADVHYAENTASRTAKWIDELSQKDESEILAVKSELVAALAKTAKPYFGDLAQMTYGEVLARLQALLAPGKMPKHVPADGVWFDVSYRHRFRDFALRAWERLGDGECSLSFADSAFDDPHGFLQTFTKALPQIKTEILHTEDVDYFLALCRRPGKPVNFVPVIDKTIKRWFKSDSLWQAHDPRYRADEVLTIPGTLAIKGVRKVDEPVAQIFSGFADVILNAAQKRAKTQLPSAFAGAVIPKRFSELPDGVVAVNTGKDELFAVESKVPPTLWHDFLVSFGNGAIAAALRAKSLTWGNHKRGNAIQAALYPQLGARVAIQTDGESIAALKFTAPDQRSGLDLYAKGQALETVWRHSCPDGRVVSLTLIFKYNPQNGRAPLQISETDARKSVSQFYQKLWLGETGLLSRRQNLWQDFVSDETITPELLQNFLTTTGSATSLTKDSVATPGLSIALLWRPLAQCLFQNDLGVDFLRLLHLSNRFEVAKSQSLQVGDQVLAKVRLRRIRNESHGRTLSVEGVLERDGKSVLKLTTQFLIRVPSGEDAILDEAHFDEEKNLNLDAVACRYLESQDWFRAVSKAKIQTGECAFAISGFDRKYRDGLFETETTGEIRQDGRLVGRIALKAKSRDLRANAVYDFAKRFAKVESAVLLKGGAHFSETLVAPRDASAYARASFDLNPIHTDSQIAALAGLPQSEGRTAPILHGMWTSAAAMAALNRVFPEPMMSWQTEFVGMVKLGEKLIVSGRQTEARSGNRVFEVTVTGEAEQTVLTGRAEILQKPVAYLFTGQGSQVAGMGMAAYDSSPAARALWDIADKYCQTELGFSILKIVRENPKAEYVAGELVSHPKGILNLTQFAQVGLTVLAMAQIQELQASGVYQDDAVFAGHSLGEYAALGCAGIIPLASVIRVVYQRGLTMQHFVPRDAEGRSPYAMAVVRPKMVGMNEDALDRLVKKVAGQSSDGELYVVNYNIEGSQYSVTGRMELLRALEAEFRSLEKARHVNKPSFIWIEGVDVPFHSPILKPGVAAFRDTLEQTIPQKFSADILIQRYIPNLNAEPFSIDKSYAQRLLDLTGSPVLKKILPQWPDFRKIVDEDLRTQFARLLLIELLAYQFASPVQWIRTQKVLLTQMSPSIGRIIEVGPSAVLTNMMKATLLTENLAIPPEVLHFDSARDLIFGKVEPEMSLSHEAVTSPQAQAVEAVPVQTVTKPASGAVAALADRPYDLGLALRCLLALKLNVRVDEIRDTETIEALSGGNSARRNEILSEIGAEFAAGTIDDAHQMPFQKLSELLQAKASVQAPGAVLQKAIDRALKEKVGLTKKDVLDHLANERLLPAGMQSSALALLPALVRSGVSTRSGALSAIPIVERLTDRAQALAWVDQFADALGSVLGVAIPKRQTAGAGGEALVDSQALQELEDKYFGPNSPFAKWAHEIASWNAWAPSASSTPAVSEELEQLKIYKDAFGSAVERVATPIFDSRKIVSLRSSWNWTKRDLVTWAYAAIRNNRSFSNPEMQSLKTRATSELVSTVSYLLNQAESQKANHAAKSLQNLLQDLSAKTGPQPTHWDIAVTRPQVVLHDDGRLDYQEVPRESGNSGAKWLETLTKSNAVSGDESCRLAWRQAVQSGLLFAGRTAFVTGAAPGSIAWDVVRQLLAGGARVVATTSSYNEDRLLSFRKLYQEVATPSSELHILPFSQGSRLDIEEAIRWCLNSRLIPDILVPFAAGSESATLTMMTPDASTATLRVLLQGVEWLIASIAKNLRGIRATNKPCLTLLPLSPNHGVFGGDGAYADAKLGLEALLNRWHSEYEDWGRYVSLIGTTIGWVRGTGLMSGNNFLAATLETQAGVRTFSSAEAGFLLASLCDERVREAARKKPLRAAFTGGFEKVPDLARLATQSRTELENEARLRREVQKVSAAIKAAVESEPKPVVKAKSKAKISSTFPRLPDAETLKRFSRPFALDRDDTVVVVGYAEVSPFGSSRARFEIECDGRLSVAGAIELAWIMGLIRYEDGTGRGGYVGWVDAKSGEMLGDDQIAHRYKDVIRAGTGVRITDAEIQGFDPRSVIVFGDVVLENSLTFTVETEDLAQAYLRHYGQMASVRKTTQGFVVELPKGAIVKVPRRAGLTRWVAGQIPKGWDATRFGVPKEIATQIDRNTLYNLVASADAFDSAGLSTDELHTTLSPSQFANTQGGGMGGMTALNRMYHDLREDKPRQGDALQETLINVGPAWVTQSLTGAYGPTVNPVAACATALVSLAVGCDLIATRKAEFVVAGGYDDYSEEGVLGFQDMAATCDTAEMLARGFSPHAMSRPNDARRGGFVEAQGGGTVLLTSLSRALALGLPIYGVLAFANNYSDGVHTSIPAPGLGLLTMASGGKNSQLGLALRKIGLTADDITVVSKHDTSTAANDPNENKLHTLVQKELGRTPGHPLFVHSQKAALGHAKGGAGAWQTAAALQMLSTGRIPGNPNLEDVDSAMREFGTLCFNDQTLDFGENGVHAVIATSLGFGHVGAVAVFAHPNFVLSKLSAKEYDDYKTKRLPREVFARKRRERVLTGKEKLFAIRKKRLDETQEVAWLLQRSPQSKGKS